MNNIRIKEITFLQMMKVIRSLTKEDYGYINGRTFMIQDLLSSILRLGIYVDGKLAGFCAIHMSEDYYDHDKVGGDVTIAVDPKYRGMGLSNRLLTEVKNKMKNNMWGITRLYYGVFHGNNISNIVARKNNFKYIEQDKRGYRYYCDL